MTCEGDISLLVRTELFESSFCLVMNATLQKKLIKKNTHSIINRYVLIKDYVITCEGHLPAGEDGAVGAVLLPLDVGRNHPHH